MTTDKIILDACCGSRMMWFNKNHPLALYADIRSEEHTLCDDRQLVVKPDIEMDFTNMPFADETFNLVAWDPPHMNKLGKSSWMAKKYGTLNYHWRDDLRDGFNECMRVLKDRGILIFKWNETQIRLVDVLPLFSQQPLFGHTSGRHGKTIWLTFMKGA